MFFIFPITKKPSYTKESHDAQCNKTAADPMNDQFIAFLVAL